MQLKEDGPAREDKSMKYFSLFIHGESMEQQKLIIMNAFDTLRDKLEQIDDVSVIGVRI